MEELDLSPGVEEAGYKRRAATRAGVMIWLVLAGASAWCFHIRSQFKSAFLFCSSTMRAKPHGSKVHVNTAHHSPQDGAHKQIGVQAARRARFSQMSARQIKRLVSNPNLHHLKKEKKKQEKHLFVIRAPCGHISGS